MILDAGGVDFKPVQPAQSDKVQNTNVPEVPKSAETDVFGETDNAGADSLKGEYSFRAAYLAQNARNSETAATSETSFGVKAKTITDKNVSGAYFVKSETDVKTEYSGIETTDNISPTVSTDKARWNFPAAGNYDANSDILTKLSAGNFGPLDRPSIYLGGKIGGQEVDAGLVYNPVVAQKTSGGQPVYEPGTKNPLKTQTWTTDPDGSSRDNQLTISGFKGNFLVKTVQNGVETSDVVLTSQNIQANSDRSITLQGTNQNGDSETLKLYPNFAFRPFYRTDFKGQKDSSGKLFDADRNGYADNYPSGVGRGDDVSVYAGETFDMSLKYVNGKAELRISTEYGSSSFSAKVGNPAVGSSFKRVDSVDQKGREGNTVLPTQTRVSNGNWGQTVIDRNGKPAIPFTSSVFSKIVSTEISKNYDLMNSPDGKGRLTKPDGSEIIYNRPSAIK